MDLSYLQNKTFTVVMVYDDGTAQGDWRLLPGVADVRAGQLFLHPTQDIDDLLIPASVCDQIRPVTADIRDVLGDSEYFLVLRIAPAPETDDDDDDEQITARFIPLE